MSEALIKDIPLVSEWACDSNEAIKIRFVEPSFVHGENEENVREFSPDLTYQMFTNQQIFGYKDLKIKLYFSSSSMATYFNISYSEKIPDGSINLADDVKKILTELLPDDYLTNYDAFLQKVQTDAETFRPMGEKISEYRLHEDDDKVYEVYKATFKTPRFKEFHRRLRIFVLFYIEAGSYIDEDEDHWEDTAVSYFRIQLQMDMLIFLEIVNLTCSLWLARIFKKAKLYQNIYQYCIADPRIKQLVVEDPSELFTEIRDKCDIRFLRKIKVLEGLKAPVDRTVIDEIWKKYKFNKRQLCRCIEIELLRNLNKTDPVAYKAYRLQVKQRLYHWNKELLDQVNKTERIQKLDEAFKGIEEEYQQLILRL
ncbi:7470_t:CDS:2 [Acaulospora morrowiae]|uniref:Histone acetyltransferase type B catalytic subunit n=1 Tax=Acaulospora morrowiae TaxID=94023 RepID=A0A9N9DHW1_9GLOM|nr:7470_t:CDS:2 [Acaulospora morrowiae]